MEAIFKRSNRVLFIVYLMLDLLWVGACAFLLINQRLTAGDIVVCALIAVAIFIFGMIPYLYNYKAYLHIKGNKIVGRFGFFRHLECDVAEVSFVLARFDTMHIVLKDRRYYIMGIKNAYAVSAFLQRKIPISPCDVRQELIETIKKRTRERKKNTLLTFCALGLAFVWVFITIFLTGARDLPDFSNTDWVIFSIMWVLEVPTVIATFVFAIRSGKGSLQLEKRIYETRRSLVERTPLLTGPGTVKAVLTDSDCSQRITLYCDCIEGEACSACYSIESFDENYVLTFRFQSNFYTPEEMTALFEDLQNMVDITDKLINI